MSLARTLLVTVGLLAYSQGQVQAQEPAPKAVAKASREAAAKAPKPVGRPLDGPFMVKPYLQLGHAQAAGKLVLLWHAADQDTAWKVEVRAGADRPWQATEKAPSAHRVSVPTIVPHRVYHV